MTKPKKNTDKKKVASSANKSGKTTKPAATGTPAKVSEKSILIEKCKSLGITGYSKMNIAALKEAISAKEKSAIAKPVVSRGLNKEY